MGQRRSLPPLSNIFLSSKGKAVALNSSYEGFIGPMDLQVLWQELRCSHLSKRLREETWL